MAKPGTDNRWQYADHNDRREATGLGFYELMNSEIRGTKEPAAHHAQHNERGEAAGAQRDLQRLPGRAPGRSRHAHIRAHRNPHAHVARHPRAHRSQQEGSCRQQRQRCPERQRNSLTFEGQAFERRSEPEAQAPGQKSFLSTKVQ